MIYIIKTLRAVCIARGNQKKSTLLTGLERTVYQKMLQKLPENRYGSFKISEENQM